MSGSTVSPAPKVRNVLLVGHGGTGKTTIAERLLAAAGVGGGRGGILDFEPEERERSHTLALSTASFTWNDHTINLLDTPGLPDAVGDAYPAMRAADVAVFVVDASVGIQPQHEGLWEACAKLGLPRLVFLNKMDRENAAYQTHIDALRERYGKPLAPVVMPVGVEAEFNGVIDLLHSKAVIRQEGERREIAVPEERREQAERNRESLIEAIVEVDDGLLERYLEGEVPEAKELETTFAQGIASCEFFPVLCGAAELDIGMRLLANFIVEECPSPEDRAPIVGADGETRDLDGPTTVYVTKTLSDPYVGRINILRVLTGTLSTDDTLTVSRSGTAVRLHQLFTLTGKEQRPISTAGPGTILGVAKLDDVLTGDTLHDKDAPFEIEAVPAPTPYHRVALQPESAGDEDKLSTALQRMLEEDPALHVDRDAETHQVVLSAFGPTHVDVTIARLERKFGVRVRQIPVRIRYRETLAGAGKGVGRHVKQSGGHGQYGVAHIEVEPLPRGGGFEFEDRIVGGVIPNQFIPSVEKGIVETMSRGVLAGYPVVDVRVALVDGKHHPVDSSQVAFETAGSLAFRDAARDAGVNLLEPILEVEVTVPDELTGDVMGDLSSRRGRIQGTDQARPGHTAVRAHVPEAEMMGYIGEFRSLASGAGSVTMSYDHHEEVPSNVAEKIIAAEQEENG